MKKNLRIGGYARVSTDEQKKYGYSIQAQIDEIKNWCSEHNHQLQNIYIDEGYSASNMKRPQLQAMLSNLKNLDALLKDHIATISSITSETKDTTEKELKELRKELDNLNYIFIKKRMPVSTYERLYAETEDKIKRLESFKPQSTDHLNQFLNSGWRSIYDNLTRENKRTLWRNVLDSVHVSPDGIEVFFK